MYKQMQAWERKIIRDAKRKYWRQYCDTIGKSTPFDEVWGMIKKMSVVRRESGYPVLEHEGVLAVKDEEKADMLVHVLAIIHSSDSMTTEGKIYRDRTKKEYSEYLENNEERKDTINASFNLDELKPAINTFRVTSPGKDQISYVMLSHLSKASLEVLLELYNRVWLQGQLPRSWKLAVMVAIGKPGKNHTMPNNYRPIARTSHICKIMGRMVTDGLNYYLESRSIMSNSQSGFRKR